MPIIDTDYSYLDVTRKRYSYFKKNEGEFLILSFPAIVSWVSVLYLIENIMSVAILTTIASIHTLTFLNNLSAYKLFKNAQKTDEDFKTKMVEQYVDKKYIYKKEELSAFLLFLLFYVATTFF